jgi:dolichyldiphosphatase
MGGVEHFSLTHFEYHKGDVLGYASAWLSLVPLIVGVVACTALLLRRELEQLLFIVATLCNVALNVLLKRHVFRELRPVTSYFDNKQSFGMPSNHAQFMAFSAAYVVCWLYASRGGRHALAALHKWSVANGVVCAAVAVAAARVYLGVHSVAQVAYGLLIGTVLGLAAHVCVLEPTRCYLFPRVETWRVAQWLRLRDNAALPDLMRLEFALHRAAKLAAAEQQEPCWDSVQVTFTSSKSAAAAAAAAAVNDNAEAAASNNSNHKDD